MKIIVYDDINTIPKQHINAGLNNLFGEVMWFYPNAGSGTVNRMVAYNYLDSSNERPVWTTGTLARTAWQDSADLVNHMQQNMIQVQKQLIVMSTMFMVIQMVHQHTMNMKQV